jgi:hypothetical protein
MLYPLKYVRFALAASALVVAGCGTSANEQADAGQDCLSNPQCPVGMTCWPTSATAFACLPSDPSAGFGADCIEYAGKPTCADGLFCDATNANGSGTCTSYCSATIECRSGYSCFQTSIEGDAGTSVEVCRATPTGPSPPDAGIGLESDGAFTGDASLSDDVSAEDAAPLPQ